MAPMTAKTLAVAAMLLAEGALAYHLMPSAPAQFVAARRRLSRPPSLHGPRGGAGALVPMKMSFVPDKEAIKKNFAKVPDAIILRDPIQLEDGTTKVARVAHAARPSCQIPDAERLPGQGGDPHERRVPYQLRHRRRLRCMLASSATRFPDI